MRRRRRTGLPFGDETFLERLERLVGRFLKTQKGGPLENQVTNNVSGFHRRFPHSPTRAHITTPVYSRQSGSAVKQSAICPSDPDVARTVDMTVPPS